MKQTAFITGATSGIGKATATIFAKNNIRLILCGRRIEKLKELEKELGTYTDVTTLSFDVSKREDVKNAVNSLPENFKKIDILINNAGNAHGLSSLQEGNIDDWDAMIDGNVKGVLYVTKAIVPQMVERNNGFIV
ncbi:MAG: SDR family NAD(P)-dependent oxidoreductase, partial [Polaribacter sp.]|nr:SDR family NAD(P)-dependent oxidoreductase [Polaribacter sp.]